MKQNRIIDAVLYHDLIQFLELNDDFKVFELFDLQPFLRVKKVQDVSVLRQLVPRSFGHTGESKQFSKVQELTNLREETSFDANFQFAERFR